MVRYLQKILLCSLPCWLKEMTSSMARTLQKLHVQFFLAGKAMTGHSGIRLLWGHPGRHCTCLESRWVAGVSKANTPGQTLCYSIFNVKIWIKSILMCGGLDRIRGFRLKLVDTFHRCYRGLPSNSPHPLGRGEERGVSCGVCSSHHLSTPMLGILKKKIVCRFGIADSLYFPQCWIHWCGHTGPSGNQGWQTEAGETQQRLLASGRDVSRWLSDVGFWRPSVHQEAI